MGIKSFSKYIPDSQDIIFTKFLIKRVFWSLIKISVVLGIFGVWLFGCFLSVYLIVGPLEVAKASPGIVTLTLIGYMMSTIGLTFVVAASIDGAKDDLDSYNRDSERIARMLARN